MTTILRTRIAPTVLAMLLIAGAVLWFGAAYAFVEANRGSKDGISAAPVWAMILLLMIPSSTFALGPMLVSARREEGARLRWIDYCGLAAGAAPFIAMGILFLMIYQ